MGEIKKEIPTEAETAPPPLPASGAATVAPPEGPPSVEERPNVPGFEILEELGRGGMGVVYKARQMSLSRFVALKMILAGPYAGAEHLARFRAEAEAVASLQHPGIVQIHEIGSHAGRSYLALEYVPGGTLAGKCAGRPLPPAEAARLVETLARSMHYAHQRGVVHRDLKPGNVLLTEDGQPKITDFGLAKRLETEPGATPAGPLTQSGAILGTPAYMAPEQAGGRRGAVGPAADVYALGAILYELLTGRPPFGGGSPVDVVLQVVSEEPVAPRRVEPTCPPDLEAVCLQCLRKEPARRYAGAAALADDLRRFLAGEHTQARPPTRVERVRRWAWRRRWQLAAGAVAVCLLLALAGSLALNALALSSGGRVNPSPPPTEDGSEPPDEGKAALTEDLELVPRDSVLFVSLAVGDLWKRQDVRGLNDLLVREKLPPPTDWLTHGLPPGVPVEDLQRITFVNMKPEQAEPLFVAVVQTVPSFSGEQLRQQVKSRGLTPRQFRGQTYFAGPDGQEGVCIRGDHTFVAAAPWEESLREWIARVPEPGSDGPLRPALGLAASGHHVVVGAALTPKFRDGLIAELQRALSQPHPADAPAAPDLSALADARAAILTADLSSRADGAATDGLEAILRLDYADGTREAERLQTLLGLRDLMASDLKRYATGELEGVPPPIAEELTVALRAATAEQRGASGRIRATMRWEPGWPATAVAALKDEDARVQSLNNLHQLALGVYNYESQFNHLPGSAITDPAGKPLLSWRVALLPYVNQAALYQEFKLDEAWDGPHNKKLLERMPAIYAPPLQPPGWKPNTTYYQVFVGDQTLFPPGRPMRLQNVTDGTAFTLMIVEAGEAVPWTKPEDLPYDPARPLPALGGIFYDGFQAVFADGRSGASSPATSRRRPCAR